MMVEVTELEYEADEIEGKCVPKIERRSAAE